MGICPRQVQGPNFRKTLYLWVPERIVHTSRKPISESLQLSLLLLLLLLLLRSAASGDVGCFLRLFGSRLVHLSTLSPVSKSAFHSVLPVVGLVTMAHLQQALSSHCCYWQLLLLGSKTADAGGAGELPLFALKAMPLALRFHRAGLLGILGDTLPGPLLSHVPSIGVADRSVCERERHCSEWSKVSLRPALALASLLDKRLRTQAARKHPCAMVLVPSVGRWSLVVAVALPRVLATQVFRFQDSRHLLPMHLVSSRCSVLRQTGCHSIVHLVENRLIVLVFEKNRLRCRQGPSIHPSVRNTCLAQSGNAKGPNGSLIAAQAPITPAHRTVPVEKIARLPTLLSCAVFPSRATAKRRCKLVTYSITHVNRSRSAGTSAPDADSTANLIGLAFPVMTCTELSAAPLDCGSPSAAVSCAVQQWKARRDTETPLSGTPNCPNLWVLTSTTFSQLGRYVPFAGIT